MTRIIAGSAKGKTLAVPKKGTRPTSDKVRGAIFSRLQSWNAVDGAQVLDLYAGSGALALEALSRGAAFAVAVEKSAHTARIIRQNAQDSGLVDQMRVSATSVETYLRRTLTPGPEPRSTPTTAVADPGLVSPPSPAPTRFDLVFVDPPYNLAEDEVATVLRLLAARLTPAAVVVVERDARSPQPSLPAGLALIDSKTWGDTRAWFMEPNL